MKTALYAGVLGQHRRTTQIASQTAALKEFAAAHEFAVPEDWVFEDAGYSGASLVRPAWSGSRPSRRGQHQAVLVHAPDRLSRKYAYQVLLTEEFARQGVETVFVKARKSATPEDQLLVQFQGMIAEYEAGANPRAFPPRQAHRAKAVRWPYWAPRPTATLCQEDRRRAGPASRSSPPRPGGALVFEQYTLAGLSIGAIARLLNARGCRPAAGAALGTLDGVGPAAQSVLPGHRLLRQNADGAAPAG